MANHPFRRGPRRSVALLVFGLARPINVSHTQSAAILSNTPSARRDEAEDVTWERVLDHLRHLIHHLAT